MESDEDLDLLFITYRTDEIAVDQLVKAIEEHGFKAEVKEEP
jgi:hypothetical protein